LKGIDCLNATYFGMCVLKDAYAETIGIRGIGIYISPYD